jgi:hypothetical protein
MEGCCPNAGAVDDGCLGLSADSRLLRQPFERASHICGKVSDLIIGSCEAIRRQDIRKS